jgi:hypothetical protein
MPTGCASDGRKDRWVSMRATLLAVIVVLASGCSSLPVPTQPSTAWGDRVPEAAQEVVAAQPVVAHGPSSITLLPISPTGAVIATDYTYDMPHCGINSPIDVDGSYWDAVGLPPDSTEFDGHPGTFRLTSTTAATFTASDGQILVLVRHAGAKEFRLCS